MRRTDPVLVAILAALSSCSESYEDQACYVIDDRETKCLNPADVDPDDLYLPGQCGDDLEIVDAHGPIERRRVTSSTLAVTWNCCYRVEVVDHDPNAHCSVGRPYQETRGSAVAELVGDADDANTAARAQAWAKAGLGEHASIAAFNRLGLQLLHHGAPTELLRDVHQAAIDETRHAETCFRMVERFGGSQVRAGAFPFSEPIDANAPLEEVTYLAAREGCLAETVAAHATVLAARLAPDPDVRQALATIAEDETRHAALSYQIVQWAMASGGASVRLAAERAFGEPCPRLDHRELALRAGLDEKALSLVVEDAQERVLGPAISALMA